MNIIQVNRVELQQRISCSSTDETPSDWYVRVWAVGCAETGPLQISFESLEEATKCHEVHPTAR